MILLLTNDLMFQSRVSGAVKGAGRVLLVDRTVERLIERCESSESVELGLIDLTLTSVDLESAIATLKEAFPKVRLVAFGPHVDELRLREAVDAGVDHVMTRGQFDRDLNKIVAS